MIVAIYREPRVLKNQPTAVNKNTLYPTQETWNENQTFNPPLTLKQYSGHDIRPQTT